MHHFRGKTQSVFLFHPTSSLHLPESSTLLIWALLKGINGFTFTAFSDERQTLSPLQVRDFKIKALISKLHTDRHPPQTAKTNLRMRQLIQTSGINHSFLQIVHDGDGDEGRGVLRPSGAAQGWLGTSRGAGRLSVAVRASCTLVLGTAAASLPDTGLTETNARSVPIKHPRPLPSAL